MTNKEKLERLNARLIELKAEEKEVLKLINRLLVKSGKKVDRRFQRYPKEKYVVPAVELRPLVREWVDRGNTLIVLAERCGLSAKTLSNILNKDDKFVYATNADKLLTALNATHLHLTEVPNPFLRDVDLDNDDETC